MRRGEDSLGASPDLVLQQGDVLALGGKLGDLTANLGLIGAEVDDAKALSVPLDQAEILVTDKAFVGKPLRSLAAEDFAGQLQVTRLERSGEPLPAGP